MNNSEECVWRSGGYLMITSTFFVLAGMFFPSSLGAFGAESSIAGERDEAIRHYWPEGMVYWDSWYLVDEGKVHAFYLQKRRPGSTRPAEDHCSIGHAVSEDLLNWKELPVALHRGAAGSYDCGPLYTGCAVWDRGTYYLFYTANGRHPNPPVGREWHPWIQTIRLATSKDGIISQNPLATRSSKPTD